MNENEVWRSLLALAKGLPEARMPAADRDTDADALIKAYLPLCRGTTASFVVAHLGQSLDGRIAAANGASRWLTGELDRVHTHRLRALFDAVLVGAGTVRCDDPQLTVRMVQGAHPVRVVLDARRRLSEDFKVFHDGAAPTLLLCAGDASGSAGRHGKAEIVALPAEADGTLAPDTILAALAARGLKRVFVEGGGVTVSRFLAAGCLHRLQIVVAPVIVGSGRPSMVLPPIDDLADSLRPPARRLCLGDDVLFECRLRD